jgi:hypothetical protein
MAKKKTIQKSTFLFILIILLAFEFSSCAKTVEPVEEISPPTSTASAAPPTPETSETPTATQVVSTPSSNGRPIVISYIETTASGVEIISSSLNRQSNYSSIPVATKTKFQGLAAIDDENNLYLVYGARENYLSKLSIDGKVETVELPYRWRIQTRWVNDKLFVLPKSADNSMAVIDTNLQITTLSPAIDALDDGSRSQGQIGISNTSPAVIVWFPTFPITDETGDYALYRTLSLDSLEMDEQMLKIPDSKGDANLIASIGLGPDNRLITAIIGIDLLNNNALLCYDYGTTDRLILTNLEIFDLDAGESLTSFQYCCMGRTYDLRGNVIIENASHSYYLRDFQPVFEVTDFIDVDRLSYHWVNSNGNYWQILTTDEIIVIDEDGQLEARYNLPSTLPIMDLIPESTFLSAFLMDN